MSEQEPKGPYIYQPFGTVSPNAERGARLYGIGGVSVGTTITGLTRDEAERILAALLETMDGGGDE